LQEKEEIKELHDHQKEGELAYRAQSTDKVLLKSYPSWKMILLDMEQYLPPLFINLVILYKR
jgi:hypothetical protein